MVSVLRESALGGVFGFLGGLVVHLSVRRLCGVCGCFDGELLMEISRNCIKFWGLVLVLKLRGSCGAGGRIGE